MIRCDKNTEEIHDKLIMLYGAGNKKEAGIYIYIFTNSSVRAGCDSMSIFKQSSTGSNSKFSFS